MAGDYVDAPRVCGILYDLLGWQKFSELADILGGRLIRIPKRIELKSIIKYERDREYYDALPGYQAARELGMAYGSFRNMKTRKNNVK